MPVAVLAPWDRSSAVELASAWWKRLLPVGEIDYKGRRLKFTRDYLHGLKQAFDDGAYDQVPFQLADAANTHTNDPERTRGEIAEMDVRPDGLWIRLDPSAAGASVLTANPKLGVSARIVEGYERADGRFYPAAIQHVLGTLDPRIPGLGPWQAVDAANTADQVIDLSGASFTTEPGGTAMPDMPEMTDEERARLARLLALPEDQIAALEGGMLPSPDELGDEDGGELAAEIDAMSDEEFAAMLAEFEAEEEETVGAGAPEMSAEAQFAIDLANARAEEASREVGVISQRLAEQDYMVERRRFADLGIPPYITDLARPLLEGAGHAVELAGGSRVDAGQIMRRVLTEVAQQAQLLDLGTELGSSHDEPDQGSQAAGAREALIGRARAQMFGL